MAWDQKLSNTYSCYSNFQFSLKIELKFNFKLNLSSILSSILSLSSS